MRKPLIVVCGPTASGKTALSIMLAKHFGGEVVSADSMQIYKGMDIGTAKPTAEEMQGVPHHMIDIVQPDENYSVGRYVKEAEQECEKIYSCGALPVVVGGTGLYIDNLIDGTDFGEESTDGAVRESLSAQYDAEGGTAMLKKLSECDAAAAARLHANDKKRIVRALEIFSVTGKPISYWQAQSKLREPKYNAVYIGLTARDRQRLYDRINSRVDKMFERGLEQEVKKLLSQGISSECTAMQAIGYKETAAYLRGEMSLFEAVDLIKQGSRRYAKRQLTWFRRNKAINWFETDAIPLSEIFDKCKNMVDFSK